jgi:hypothetical protein
LPANHLGLLLWRRHALKARPYRRQQLR